MLSVITILVGIIFIAVILLKNDKHALVWAFVVGVIFLLATMLAWLATADLSIIM